MQSADITRMATLSRLPARYYSHFINSGNNFREIIAPARGDPDCAPFPRVVGALFKVWGRLFKRDRRNPRRFPRGPSFLRQLLMRPRAIFMAGPPPSMPSRVAPLGHSSQTYTFCACQAALIQHRIARSWFLSNKFVNSTCFCARILIILRCVNLLVIVLNFPHKVARTAGANTRWRNKKAQDFTDFLTQKSTHLSI